jgi:L,D-transpeptidase ErfK/SrfK
MKMHSLRTAAAAATVCLALTACSLLGGRPKVAPPAQPAPPPPPAEAEPLATQRFELVPDQTVVGQVQVVKASKEDTLTDIARRFNIGYDEIVRANPKVDPWLPGEGRTIILPTEFILPNAPHEGIIINVAAMRIFYYPPHKRGEPEVVITHPIGIGKVGWATPEGVTKIVRRQRDPTWRVPDSVIKEHRENGEELERVYGPGPDNPLGKYAFYLEWQGYLIHGTNKPAGVGLRSSHGCIRLYPEDIEQFFATIPVGTQVRVVNQPFLFGWQDGQLYLQASDVLEDDARDWKNAERKLLTKSLAVKLRKELAARNEEVNWDLVAGVAHSPRGIPVSISDGGPNLEQVLAQAPLVQNRVPEGSTWDGKTDLPMDEATFRQMLSEIDPSSKRPGAAPAAPAARPTGAVASPQVVDKKTGS